MGARVSPRGLEYMPLPVRGGMWMDDATRPEGYCRVSVNIRNGAVRPGSLYDDVLATSVGSGTLPNCAFDYRSEDGQHFKLILRGTTNPTVGVVRGSRVVTTASIGSQNTAHTATRVTTWAAFGSVVAFCGPTDGRIGIVDFGSDGIASGRTARGYDRTVNPFGLADDDGPWRLAPPRAVAVTRHQGRLVLAGENGSLYIGNPFDVDGIAVNLFLTLGDGPGTEVFGGFASVAEGRFFVGDRNNVYDVQGSLGDLATTTVARRAASGLGPIAPASVQVLDNGKVMYLSESGPVLWAPGTYQPGSGEVTTFDAQIGALFRSGFYADFDIERYRPRRAYMRHAISRYSRKNQVYEVAMAANHAQNADPEDRNLRLRYHVPTGAWSIEIHADTRGFGCARDAHGEEVLYRVDSAGRLFFEDVGDIDTWSPLDERATAARLQVPFVNTTPERGRPRYLHLAMERTWTSSMQVAVLPEGASSQDEATFTVTPETRTTVAFSSDGTSDGFVLGTSRCESDQVVQVGKRGIPSRGVGRRVRFEFSTPSTAAAGARWGLQDAQIELGGGGRTL